MSENAATVCHGSATVLYGMNVKDLLTIHRLAPFLPKVELLYGGITFIKTVTLDDASWVSPTVHIWCPEKQPWLEVEVGTAQLPRNPG
jgi:hypothetical protein